MATTLSSPGVLARENDQSQVRQGPIEVGAAILGPTAIGPVGIPTLVTSFSEFTNKFGSTVESGSQIYSYLTSISANNYFANGGTSLLVCRVQGEAGSWDGATASITDLAGDAVFSVQTLSQGTITNFSPDEVDNTPGTVDNVKIEITGTNPITGTFDLIVRRGDDSDVNKIVLESYSKLSLDPYSSNYISRIIGDRNHVVASEGSDFYVKETGMYDNNSKYIRISQVNALTPNYVQDEDESKLPIISTSCPKFLNGGGELFQTSEPALFNEGINGDDTQGMLGTDYNTSIALLGNKDEYKFNIITAPGLIHEFHSDQVNNLMAVARERGDCIAVIDLNASDKKISTVTTQSSALDNSYAATYWPWVQTLDPFTGRINSVPPSTMIPGVFAYTDSSSEPWFAPAGITRGGLSQVTKADIKLTSGQRDTLYNNNINPIASFPRNGVVVFGQKTLQKKASSLDRINVRRLLIELKDRISQVSDNLVFEQNTIATRNNFLVQVNPYLESVQQRQGLYAFKVVMDETNNTSDVIDRNELLGQIFIQPTKTAEYVILDFNVMPTGATFSS